MNTVQCYTPSGGPSCRTQGLGSAVAHKDYIFVFFCVCPWSPSGSRAVARPLSLTRIIFLSFLGRCRSYGLMSAVGSTRTIFLVFVESGLLLCSRLASAIVWRLSWFNKININGAQRAYKKGVYYG